MRQLRPRTVELHQEPQTPTAHAALEITIARKAFKPRIEPYRRTTHLTRELLRARAAARVRPDESQLHAPAVCGRCSCSCCGRITWLRRDAQVHRSKQERLNCHIVITAAATAARPVSARAVATILVVPRGDAEHVFCRSGELRSLRNLFAPHSGSHKNRSPLGLSRIRPPAAVAGLIAPGNRAHGPAGDPSQWTSDQDPCRAPRR